MPVNTFRVWFLGLTMTLIMASINQVLQMRSIGLFLTPIVAQLLSFPFGKLMERTLPTTRFRVLTYTWSFNPCPFNIKEHTLITMMAAISYSGAYATDTFATQRIFFNNGNPVSLRYQLMLALSSQLIGLSWAGFMRKVLVWPSIMIWPDALVTSALLNTFHREVGKCEPHRMSRFRYFTFVMAGSFIWYWFPGYIFTGLSVFSWICWIVPNNVVVNQLFGYNSGLGMGVITFDWSLISFNGSPLVTPWWAQMNILVIFVLLAWVVLPIMYYTNTFYSKFLPMNAPYPFDNMGLPYNITAITRNNQFDLELYKAYSPLFLPLTFVMEYGGCFVGLTAVFTQTFLWHRNDVMRHLRYSMKDHLDVHTRLMSRYPEVPYWWYTVICVLTFALAVLTIVVFDTQLPVWGLVLALGIGSLFTVPGSFLAAMANQGIQVNVLAELVVGYVLPGKPVTMMIFKVFATASYLQSLQFASNMKLAHYMKIPPRLMFSGQVIAALLAVIVVVVVQESMFSNIPDFCDPHQADQFTCPRTRTYASAAIIWGGIGPKRIFSSGAPYHIVTFGFLLGAVLPIPFYYLAKRYPLSILRYINVAVATTAIIYLPTSTLVSVAASLAVGSVFQFYLRRRHFRWWSRYNYITSGALDGGVAIATIVNFLTLQLPRSGTIEFKWWGNTVWQNTADFNGAPLITLKAGETFGPKFWS
ncbi:glutathione transporter [Rickenella mellea]|uniref:Glutathione transporter n=1 Tax=Rickenella mellea TaxID=50990 RepID=A0A4Y7Q4T4_9AGAM|nr:glutathione transporter [Rickenella mellea]